jgi:Zn-dependent peptidase ImmA (M78 family)/transcriptional regulator with XRE-family HTH domain
LTFACYLYGGMGDKAIITAAVLKWARETARITVEQASARAGVAVQKVQDWEQGVDQPTIRQAKLLAELYKRPFALFMLPAPPRDFTPLRDFRRKNAAPLTTGTIFIIRELQEKQAWTREWYEEEGMKPLPFVGRYSMRNSPAIVASNLLAELGIHPPNYTHPMKEWVAKAEAKGIFISRTSFISSHLKLNSDEFQGFAIADALAPFIFINSEDWDAAQLFTLVHELVHIWIAQSGISNEVGPDSGRGQQVDPVERFCNEAAAAALMPEEWMKNLPATVFASADAVYGQARQCGVSSFALLVRALDLEIITTARYGRLKKEADQAFQAFQLKAEKKQAALKEREGGPNPYRLRTIRNGLQFSRLVLDAFRGGFIQPTQASSLLNTPINHFPKLEAFVYA